MATHPHLTTQHEYMLILIMLCLLGSVSTKFIPEGDGSFQCGDGKFKCGSQKCIPALWKCDGDDDCGDGSDEVQCTPATCRPDIEFTCRNKRCIPSKWVCDKETDCSDGSDEDSCSKPTCKPNFYQCNNTRCIPEKWKCDKQDDCGDNSDETTCEVPKPTCKESEFQCTDGKCIFKHWKCDGDDDCEDGSDEMQCLKKNTTTCRPSEFACSNGRCIPEKWHCDGTNDCLNGLDEQNCTSPLPKPKKCSPDFWQCKNGDCIKKDWQCDGQMDCADESDEKECVKVICHANQFSCKNGRQCVFASSKCNTQRDCDDGSDEENCGKLITKCGAHHFNCSDKTCIDESKVCDLNSDCPNNEDESIYCFINECNAFNGHCMHQCVDKRIGYECRCKSGYKLSSDKHSCEDINECDTYGTCHQLCENTKGNYKCSCAEGYLLEPNRKSCKATDNVGWVYFANRHDIRKITIDQQDFTIAVENCSGVISFDFHTSHNKMYYSDIVTETIYSLTIDKPSSKKVVMQNVHTPDGLAVDWVSGKIYWTDTGYKTIEVADLNGKHNLDLVDVGLAEPRAIALNPHAGYLYWTDWGKSAAIERISMDGELSTRKKLISDNIVWPNGLTLDLAQSRMYWLDAKLKVIESADLNGNHRAVLGSLGGESHPFALANFEDMLYWTDWRWDGVKAMSKFNTSTSRMLRTGLYAPMDVKVMHPSKQQHETNPCKNDNFGCSHLCLLANHYGHRITVCRCPRNMTLDTSHKRCVGVPTTRGPKTQKVMTVGSSSSSSTTSQSTKTKLWTSVKTIPSSAYSTALPTVKTGKPTVIAEKHNDAELISHGMSSGTVVAIIISILIIILLIIFVIVYIRRRNIGKGHVMFYKDMSAMPLEDDFDIQDPMDDKAKIISED